MHATIDAQLDAFNEVQIDNLSAVRPEELFGIEPLFDRSQRAPAKRLPLAPRRLIGQ